MARRAQSMLNGAAVVLFATTAIVASAQPAGLTLRPRHSGRIAVDPGATATLVYLARNAASHSATVEPQIIAPADWQIVTGGGAFQVAAGAADVWVIGVSVPSGSVAGEYKIAVGARGATAVDTAVLVVRERVALELRLVDRPSHAIAGERYDARFLVTNRGNSAATVRLVVRSSEGAARLHGSSTVELAPSTSQAVAVVVATRRRDGDVTDDVLEMDAIHAADSAVHATASGRVLVVPRASRWSNYNTVATQVRLRAAGAGTGIAPFEVSGGGRLRSGGDEHLSFLFRGKPKGFSVFGERDEYQVDLRAPDYRIRLGDNFYMLSPLTTAGRAGFGGALEAQRGALTAGAYSQRFRFSSSGGTEIAGYLAIATRSNDRARVAVNLVDRRAGEMSGRVATAHTTVRPTPATFVDVEYAASDAAGVRSFAHAARVSGSWPAAAIDIGRHRADAAFAGPQRGSTHDYANGSLRVSSLIRLNAFGSRSSSALTVSDSVARTHGTTAGVGATFGGRLTIEATSLSTPLAPGTDGANVQRALRVRSGFSLGSLAIDADLRRGVATDGVSGDRRAFTEMSIVPRLSVFGQQIGAQFAMSGAQFDGASRTISAGLDAMLQFGPAIRLALNAIGTRMSSNGNPWMTHVDARLERQMAAGITVAARGRMTSNGLSALGSNAFYLEVGVPMRLPTMPIRGPGRVVGRVVDAQSGRGVAGAVVRLGEKVALTDRGGNVAFSNVPAGQYRVTLADASAAVGSVLLGDHTLAVDSVRRTPTRFAVQVTTGATVRGDVRRLASARTAINAAAPDSLVDGGALENVVVALQGARDTLYQTTDRNGRIEFTDVAPGNWTLAVVAGDVPAQHAFERDRVQLALAPGQEAITHFRLVPRRRAVQMLTSASEAVGTAGGANMAARPK